MPAYGDREVRGPEVQKIQVFRQSRWSIPSLPIVPHHTAFPPHISPHLRSSGAASSMGFAVSSRMRARVTTVSASCEIGHKPCVSLGRKGMTSASVSLQNRMAFYFVPACACPLSSRPNIAGRRAKVTFPPPPWPHLTHKCERGLVLGIKREYIQARRLVSHRGYSRVSSLI